MVLRPESIEIFLFLMPCDRILFAGHSLSRGERRRVKVAGAALQPLQGSASSVGRRLLRHGCVAPRLCVPCLLADTERVLLERVQDRVSDVLHLWP